MSQTQFWILMAAVWLTPATHPRTGLVLGVIATAMAIITNMGVAL